MLKTLIHYMQTVQLNKSNAAVHCAALGCFIVFIY